MNAAVRERSSIYIDRKNILHYFQATETNVGDYEQAAQKVSEIYASPNPPTKIVFDMRGVKLLSMLPLRKRYIELNAIARVITKVALLSDNRLLWIFLSFNFNASGNTKDAAQDVRIFTSEDEAMKWLEIS